MLFEVYDSTYYVLILNVKMSYALTIHKHFAKVAQNVAVVTKCKHFIESFHYPNLPKIPSVQPGNLGILGYHCTLPLNN